METPRKPESPEIPKKYVEKGVEFTPERNAHGLKRYELDSMIHGCMTVQDTAEWDETMHPKVTKLKPGETTVLKSGAYEYMKVTKNANDTFDAEYGAYDEVGEE